MNNPKNTVIEQFANSFGFKEVFFLPAERDDFDCIVLLIYPYNPFNENTYVPSYYIASNKSFHAMRELVKKLNEIGIVSENVYLPIKQLACRYNIGKQGKNTLLHTQKWGSRIVLYSLLVKGAAPSNYEHIVTEDYCSSCTKCIDVCKTGAITNNGYIRERCIRNYMDNPPYPSWVENEIKTYSGCEKCMEICPYNAHIEKTAVPLEYINALNPDKILLGDVKEAKEYLGSNLKTKRLLADAQAIIKNSRQL